MTDLHLLCKAIRDYFDDTPAEEWSYLNFLDSFKPVIMSKLDASRREDQGTWRKRFITRLDKIVKDDAYSEQQKKLALRLKEKNLSSTDTFWDNIEKEKEDLRRRREIENKTNLVRDNTEIEALELLDTARTEKTKAILNSLKRKPENVVGAGKRRKLPSGNESNDDDAEESDSEVIDEYAEEEIENLTEEETNIRKEKARVYLVQAVNGYIIIKYLVRPLPSIYILQRFANIKIPVSFDDFEQFAKDMVDLMNWQIDVLSTVKAINKSTTKDYHVHITQVEDTPIKAKKVEKENKTSPSSPKSPCPGGSPSKLPPLK